MKPKEQRPQDYYMLKEKNMLFFNYLKTKGGQKTKTLCHTA